MEDKEGASVGPSEPSGLSSVPALLCPSHPAPGYSSNMPSSFLPQAFCLALPGAPDALVPAPPLPTWASVSACCCCSHSLIRSPRVLSS